MFSQEKKNNKTLTSVSQMRPMLRWDINTWIQDGPKSLPGKSISLKVTWRPTSAGPDTHASTQWMDSGPASHWSPPHRTLLASFRLRIVL